MSKYTKNAIEVEAFQYGVDPRPDWFCDAVTRNEIVTTPEHCVIKTREGHMTCMHGDYVIKGIKAEIYPCKSDIFKLTYHIPACEELKTDLTFGAALYRLKLGLRVAREGWNGKGMFLFLVPGSTFHVNREPLLSFYEAGTVVHYLPHIDMKTATGSIVPWLASQTDLLANDWMEIK
jgi:hypothetical protein